MKLLLSLVTHWYLVNLLHGNQTVSLKKIALEKTDFTVDQSMPRNFKITSLCDVNSMT